MKKYIKYLEAFGVHGRFDIELNFNEGVNILYGKNGAGKTTILHILSNALNGDFERFIYLNFHSLSIGLFDGTEIKIRKRKFKSEYRIYVNINGKQETISSRDVISQDSKRREIISERSYHQLQLFEEKIKHDPIASIAYFPAFRTMIEAWASQRELRYRRIRHNPYPEQMRITLIARDLFGQFVPNLNFSSPIEIEYFLTEMVEEAFLEVGRKDRELLSDAFLEILPSLAKTKSMTSDTPEEELSKIKDLLDSLDESPFIQDHSSSKGVYSQLRKMINSFKLDQQTKDVASRILNVYKNLLLSREKTQKEAFLEIEKYLEAVNEFLEGKKITLLRRTPDRRSRVGLQFDDNSISPLRVLSSGERQIITLIFASTRMSKQDIVLIDEPEISLHVDWQRILLGKMTSQLGGRQIITSTHSPVISVDYDENMIPLELKSTKKDIKSMVDLDNVDRGFYGEI